MKRGFLVAVGGAAIVVAGLAGCGDDTKSDTASATETTAASAPAGAPAAKVTIDGKEQQVEGTALCTIAAGSVNIAIGNPTLGIAAILSEGDSPTVTSVALGNVDGVTLGYAQGAPGGEATAKKDGNTYTITGKATGIDTANPLQPVTKPFELVVTCP